MGRQRGSSWEAFWGEVGSKQVRENDAKKGLVLAWSWGGGEGIAVRSLWAGSDKGETMLPPGRLVEHLSFKNH